MTPGNVVTPNDHAEVEEDEEEELMPEDLTPEQVKAKQKALMDAAVIGDANSKIDMDRLKNDEDNDGGLSEAFGKFLLVLDPTGTVRRRLWTRADFMHIHAVSGGYFLFLGIPWLIYSHITNALDTSLPMETSSWFLTSLLLSGLVNALSAIPMSRFNSNKMFDLKDLKANGFTFGGTGLTCMCLYIAWWFSGDYPAFLLPFDIPIWIFWALVCVGTTANWEVMLQQNFEANERSGNKFAKVDPKEMQQKAILYRLASWPNLTQLTFMYSIPFGGVAWLQLPVGVADAGDAPVPLRHRLGHGLRTLDVLRDAARPQAGDPRDRPGHPRHRLLLPDGLGRHRRPHLRRPGDDQPPAVLGALRRAPPRGGGRDCRGGCKHWQLKEG